MAEPFLGEIQIFGFNWPPRGWALCDGQVMPINQNQSLYSLLGTTYGGDGRTTFALPDLRSRVPVHRGDGHSLGSKTGAESVALTLSQLPNHTHALHASTTAGDTKLPVQNVSAASTNGNLNLYSSTTDTTMAADAVAPVGNGQAHENMQPFLTVSFCIALQGLFPSRN